jgi:predicted RND superfamily exporter protein
MAIVLADFVVRWRWPVVLVSLLVFAAAASGLGRLVVENDYRIFFGDDNPELVAFDHFQDTYTRNDNLLFVVKPKTGDVFEPRVLAAIEELTDAAWKLPFATRVDSVTNFQYSRGIGNQLIVEDLIPDAASMSVEEIAARRTAALAEPLLRDNMLAADASATGINIIFLYPNESVDEVPQTMAAARALVARIEAANPEIELGVTGGVAMNAAFNESTLADGSTLYPLMFAILVLVTALILRSITGTLITLVIIVLSTVTAVGISGYAGWPVSPASGSAPVIILTLAVADSIHILISMIGLMRRGHDKIAALKESIRLNFLAVSATSLTTCIGFLALNFSDAPPFHHLGNATAIGITAAWIYSMTFLPAALAILPFRVRSGVDADKPSMMAAFAGLVVRRHRAIALAVGLVGLGLVALVPTIEFNDDWVNYFDERLEFRRNTEFAREHLTGVYLMEYSVPAGASGAISEPGYLGALENFATWLRGQPEVLHVFSYTDIAKRLNKNMHGDDPAYYRIPEDRQLAAQYLLLYELSLPLGLDLKDRISTDQSATRVTATLSNVPTATIRDFIDRSKAWFVDNAPDYMRSEPTGATVMFAYISERNVKSMLTGNLVAVFLISLIMIVTLRSLSLGALSLIPNLLPIMMTFGVWAFLVGRVGLASATVSATSLGIIVDNTVHFLTKYLRARREGGLDRERAIIYAFETVGLAILANAAILAAGFAVLAFSTFRVTSEMGLLTAIEIVIALAVDFLLLPALLLLRHRPNEETSHANAPETI